MFAVVYKGLNSSGNSKGAEVLWPSGSTREVNGLIQLLAEPKVLKHRWGLPWWHSG